MGNQPPYDYHSQYGGDSQPTYPASYNSDYQQQQEPYRPSNPYAQPGQAGGYQASGSYNPSAFYQQPLYQQPPNTPYMPPTYAIQSPERGRGMAITGLIMGILSIFSALLPIVGLIFPILGIIFSIMGRRSVSLRTVATIGMILSIVGIVFSFIMIFVYIQIGSHPNS